MFHKLLHRGLPGSFEFNSVYAMQPMYTAEANRRILDNLKTMVHFSTAKPEVPPSKVPVDSHTAVCQILQDQGTFKSSWSSLGEKFISEKAISTYHSFQRETKSGQLYQSPKAKKIYLEFLIGKAKSLVEGATYCLGGKGSKNEYNQIDFVRE